MGSVVLTGLIVVAALLGALGRRVAGGAFQQWSGLDVGDYPVRAFFGLMLACAAMLGGLLWWHALLLVVSTFLGCSLPVGGIGMGRGAPERYWRDFETVSMHGIGSMAITCLPVLFLHDGRFWTLILAGLLIAPLYELGWRITGPDVPRQSFPVGLRGGAEWGELLWGACCGMGAWGIG